MILNNILQISHVDGLLNTENERALLIPVNAFGILQRDLIKNIGIDRMKSFFFNYGWKLGEADAKDILKIPNLSLKEKIFYATKYHEAKGHVRTEIGEEHVEFDENGKIISFKFTGKWDQSYEAEQHILNLGLSDCPVCYSLTGYASGSVSKLTGEIVIYQETQCIGQGAPCCIVEGRLLSDWEDEVTKELFYYKDFPIIKELEETNEKLKTEKDNLSMVTQFHIDLSNEMMKGKNLDSILETVYSRIQKPVVLEDIHHQIQTIVGFTPEFYEPLKNNFTKYLQTHSAVDKTTLIHSENFTRLVSPVFLGEKLAGYCSFFYGDSTIQPNEIDYMFSGRVASICSMYLFHEKAKLDSFERAKGHFLEEIISGQSSKEIMRKAASLQIDLTGDYYAIYLQYYFADSKREQNEVDFHEQIFETASHYFSNQNMNLIASLRHDSMLILLPARELKKRNPEPIIYSLLSALRKKVKNPQVLAGISSTYSNIVEAKEAFDEARTAVRLSTREDPVTNFNELGALGVLINENNDKAVRKIIKMTLGCLYENIDQNKIELIETLYTFLINGGNLGQTAEDLALSISGLRYRVSKIQSLLSRELRVPEVQFQLLLSIKALKIIQPELFNRATAIAN
jgi:sugar diacid utilization regulator/predicted hydrocarbon binding protein